MKNEGIIIICDTATFSVTYLECSTNIFSKTANKLKGVRNLFMSPDGSCLISTHHNNQLRLWNLYSYESQYLDCFTRPVSSLCWLEYDSHRLAFFTLLGSNQLYALRMSSQFFDAVKVCELLPFDYDQNSSCSIRSIAVNPQSNRLVVSFDNPDNQPSLNLLYVYSIFPQVLFVAGNSRVVLDPIGYVVSPTTNSSAVSSFSFCNQFEYGSLLAVFYSSTSTLHFFPFLSIPYNPYGNLLASTSPLLSKYNDFTLNLRELPTRGKSTSAIPRTPLCYSAFSAPSPTSFTPQSSVSSEFLADSSISASAMKRSIQLLDDLSKSSPKS
ncbi:hypothetical protein AX774_g2989 [Zancudomyces culisetae]|uniref:Uncharacterized protein n=1 Tax=Zancudomyces culisetae TaxID=1213189 RepID=A0A1R1PRD6_ZANCU|nr:hypothetical protein AX774_g2989 [Zancudomyces culisetae]|eukprot:OMH83517.1 hypothetical protein AX774_g2989 [Zancudomyces culisetae]